MCFAFLIQLENDIAFNLPLFVFIEIISQKRMMNNQYFDARMNGHHPGIPPVHHHGYGVAMNGMIVPHHGIPPVHHPGYGVAANGMIVMQ